MLFQHPQNETKHTHIASKHIQIISFSRQVNNSHAISNQTIMLYPYNYIQLTLWRKYKLLILLSIY